MTRFQSPTDIAGQVAAVLTDADGFVTDTPTHVHLRSQYDCAGLPLAEAGEAAAIYVALSTIVLAGAAVRLDDGDWQVPYETEDREALPDVEWRMHIDTIAREIAAWVRRTS